MPRLLVALFCCFVTAARPAWCGSWSAPVYSPNPPQGSKVSILALNKPFSATKTITVTATFTWQPDNGNDPAPQEVMTKEVATASWAATARRADDSEGDPSWTVSGSANNGLGASEVPAPNPNTASSKGGVSSSVRTKLHKGGASTITCTATVTAQVSGTTNPGTIGSGNVGVSYSVGLITPHAHPTNMREDSWGPQTHAPPGGTTPPNGDPMPQGAVWIKMRWDSTSGNLFDIPAGSNPNGNFDPGTLYVFEYVTFGNDTPPTPPWQFTGPIPEKNGQITGPPAAIRYAGILGTFLDYFIANAVYGKNADNTYTLGQITAKQYYRFYCPSCMTSSEYEHLDGPYDIKWSIEADLSNSGHWILRTTSHGHSDFKPLP